MDKKYLYFQQQYVSQFQCDGSKCDAHCCQGWNIFIDAKTFEQYPPEIKSRMKFSSERGEYLMELDEGRRCPFLNEKNLCSIQLKYGEKFLSQTCATYPRVANNFGYFLERSLVLSCPLAAKMILFNSEPLGFEFVEVSEKIHSLNGKLFFQQIQSPEELRSHIIEIQIAMISILQERTLSIDQRLIMLGFFIDKLEEIYSDFDENALTKLIAAYESKKFLAEKVPLMLQSVNFDAEKFIALMNDLIKKVYNGEDYLYSEQDKKFIGDFAARQPDKKFLAIYSPLLENYLVNEIFQTIYPWRFEGAFMQNFAAFVTEYKLFEQIIFSMRLKNLAGKENLLEMINWFATRFDHVNEYKQRIFNFIKDRDEPFTLMDSLLEGSDLN